MTQLYYTPNYVEYQGYRCEKQEMTETGTLTMEFKSESKGIPNCPYCNGIAVGHGISKAKLTDAPCLPGIPTVFEVHKHRYLCKKCKRTFTEKDPFKTPNLNLTKRCVEWILQFLKYKIPTATISEIMGIHWNTVRKIEKMRIDYILREHDLEISRESYRPYYLAVDEFAIRKGHRYATCVMDLVRGDVIWVGKGRSITDFNHFFEAYDGSDYLSQVKAVAMDMNASYHTLVGKFLPNAEIVYDRYHVQAQFGRDVLGQVRLDAARAHKEMAKQATEKQTSSDETKLYRKIKKARWILLQSNGKLSESKKQSLNEILETHSDLAVCYAMKEEMIHLFELNDESLARDGWNKWFDAAISSGIPALIKFGRQKRKRIDGLVAHSKFHINTGRLEGFNNKIKVAKRNAYGFRNLDYFFSYIRFISLHSSLNT